MRRCEVRHRARHQEGEMRLESHVAIVTGSTKGIGRAMAERFAAEGAKVLVTGRSEVIGEQVAEGIRKSGGEAEFLRTDVSRERDVVAAVEAACDYWGSLSILVNNAALFLASDEAGFVTGASLAAEGGALVKLPLPDARTHRIN